MKAIDLYSGVGGWSLGLQLAGIEVVASYERWGPANETNFKNNRHQAQTVDIRRLKPQDLPAEIDVVVGSPPCTQFSYSNRGGNGDVDDGLVDIKKFLSIVDHLKPKYWAMENVPRVVKVVLKETEKGGCLEEFAHLFSTSPQIINMEDYGLPQRRKRSIIGVFDFELLNSYKRVVRQRTLGDVISALSKNPIVDPIYGIKIDRENLFDHDVELPLNPEEERINWANKTLHPIYNAMSFPDKLDRSVRTITATCTRVSRESVVIESPTLENGIRRLTVRERASLQGFPITFQFYGNSSSQKQKMVGNAVPPLFSYYMGNCFNNISADEVPDPSSRADIFVAPRPLPEVTTTDLPGRKYPKNRSFRFAIPSLRLKSGVRFELTNNGARDHIEWQVNFYFGTSKSIKSIVLDYKISDPAIVELEQFFCADTQSVLCGLQQYLADVDLENMQRIWTHRGLGRTTPFMLLDELDSAGAELQSEIARSSIDEKRVIKAILAERFGADFRLIPGVTKVVNNSNLLLAGIVIGSIANRAFWKLSREPSRRSKTSG